MNHKVLSDYRKKSAFSIVAGLAAFAAVAAAAVKELPQTVENDLRIEVNSLVASQNADGLVVVVDGQDVAIGGMVENERIFNTIRNSLSNNDRVRMLELQLKVTPPKTAAIFASNTNTESSELQEINTLATIEPELKMLRVGSRLIISGKLPPNQRFDKAIEDLTSGLQVNNNLTQSIDVKSPAWLEPVLPVITTLPAINGANLEIKDNTLVLNGSVDSQAILDGINARIADIDDSSVAIHSNFWIVKPESPNENDAPLEDPEIAINWDKGRLQITGVLSSEDSLYKVRNVLLEHYKPSRTENTLKASDAVSPAPWLDELLEMLPGLQGLETAHVNVDQGKLTLSGESGNAEMPAPKKAQAQPKAEPIKVNNEIVMLDVEPESVGLELRKELDKIALDKILFEVAAADISTKSFEVLDDLARTLKKYPGVPVIIAGHTDSTGAEQANQTLSQRRADAVRDDLIMRGVDKNRISAVGYGESRPIAPNDTPEGRALNRRIEVNY